MTALNYSAAERGFGPANARVVEGWLEAIRLDRQPACSGYAGIKALEMVMGCSRLVRRSVGLASP